MSRGGGPSSSSYYMEEEEDEDTYPTRGGGGGRPSSARSSLGGGGRGMDSSGFEASDYQDEQEVAELLTKATVTTNEKTKLENLRKVSEILIKKQPALLDNFLNEMLDFQTDNNADVRKFILDFVESACKTDPETIPRVLSNMMLMLQDKQVSVQKKGIQVAARLYKHTLMWLCKSKGVTEEMETAWNSVTEMKKFIIKQIDNDLDGIRTHTVKFIESVILLQTPTEQDGLKPEGPGFCLDDVPINIKVARPRKLEEDARSLFEELLKFHGSRHATSVNLMTCMGSIIIIAKLRPSYMGRVVTAMEKLNAILPPTLERSQVTSVRKYMKMQLIGLLRHTRALDYYDNITTLLTDLGASSSELYKAIPNWEEIKHEQRRKRHRALRGAGDDDEGSSRKRLKLQQEPQQSQQQLGLEIGKDKVALPAGLEVDDDEGDDDIPPKGDEVDNKAENALSGTEKTILEKLTPEMAAELVYASMDKLPDEMPAHFTASFTPIAMAGTESQIRHVSRLLAAQITAFQLGPEAALQAGIKMDTDEYDEPTQIPTLVSGVPASGTSDNKENKKTLFNTAVPTKRKIVKALKLSEITKPLSIEQNTMQTLAAVKRILNSSEKLDEVRTRLVCNIAVTSTFEVRFHILQHIQSDVKTNLDLGISWVIAEYCLQQEFLSKSLASRTESAGMVNRYEWTFVNLMRAIIDSSQDAEKSLLARRLYLESPTIPDKGLELLKQLCSKPAHSSQGMSLLNELALKRPRKLYYLSTLLEFCAHSVDEVRNQAVTCVMELYTKVDSMKGVVEDHAVRTYMNSLRLPNPPEILFSDILGRNEVQGAWNDDIVKACLALYLQLLATKNSLIHDLAKVYAETVAEVKRSILRYVEQPVRKMGMDPPELMKLLDNFPKGAETLMTKIIHLLTDKALPSAELVQRVRNLYAKRVSDVRFLIPVLNGLTKSEILGALPKLIKLNPNVVKEVFNRLLGIHADAKTQHTSPVSPVELLVALHNIEPSKCDVKTVIKATSLCFNEAGVFTAEVLAVAINQLLEQTPLPTLLMRTVIQTLALHTKLSGFVLNTLSRLIKKEVWNQPKIWEGFVKCCQRIIPKSIPVLLTLPPPQLQQALTEAPDLRPPMVAHLMSLSDQQRSCLPPALLNIVLGGSAVKQEYGGYGEYHPEIVGMGPGGAPRPMYIKDEGGSPSGNDLSIEVKDEPMEH